MHVVTPLLLLVGAFSFALGITLPLMRFEKLYFFEETPNLLEIIAGLNDEGEWPLAIVVGLFSVVLPGLKLATLFIAGFSGREGMPIRWLSAIGKWSMMDVMLVALVVFAAKTSGLASAVTLPGIWFYAMATVATAVAAIQVRR